jgi:hypothetical protein
VDASGSVSRGRSANVFDSTSNIKREPVHTQHFLSPSTKPALPKFTRSASKQTVVPEGVTRLARSNSNVTASSDYFKPPERSTPQGSVAGRSQVSKRTATTAVPPQPLPQQPVPKAKTVLKAPLPDVFRQKSPAKDRAYSFASTIGTVPSTDGEGNGHASFSRQGSFQRSASRDDWSQRSGYSRVIIDGKAQEVRVGRSRSRSRSRDGSVGSGRQALSRSNSRSRSPGGGVERQHSPKEVQSKHKNPTTFSFRQEHQPRQVF